MAKREETRERPESQRPQRVPMFEQRSKLNIYVPDGSDKEYVYRIFNETDQFGHRIPRAQLGGWEIAPNSVYVGHPREGGKDENVSLGSGGRVQVGIDQSGQPRYGVVMRLRKEYYDEDQQRKAAAVDQTESSIRRTLDEKTEGGSYGSVGLGTRATRTPIK